ncbi:MAG: glycosyltransferase, partial [Candidatus Limnocylindria bacterium]
MPTPDRLRLAFLGDPNNVHTRRWLSWFAERGHGVHLLEGFGIEVAPGLHNGVGLERYGPHPRRLLSVGSALRARRDLRRLVERLRPDLLHAHYVRGYGWHAALAGFHPRVVSPWGSDLLRVPARAIRTRWWNRYALRGADLVTVTTDHMRRAAIRAGARPGRVQLIQHGVDTRLFGPGPAPASPADPLATGGRPLVFSPRALQPLYRHETIVDAFATVPPE